MSTVTLLAKYIAVQPTISGTIVIKLAIFLPNFDINGGARKLPTSNEMPIIAAEKENNDN